MDTKLRGRITFFIPNRRFGFIRATDGREIFFHVSNFFGVPVLSMNVEFEIAPPIREGLGPQAVNIAPIESLAQTAQNGGKAGA